MIKYHVCRSPSNREKYCENNSQLWYLRAVLLGKYLKTSAVDFVKSTGVDALAVAVGNAHGDYKFPPKLDFDRISSISAGTGLPLVLHGGSGLADDDFRIAVKRGICKVNIFTDLEKAGKAGAEKAIAEGASSLTKMIPYEIEAMKKVVEEKIRLFGSVGKA